MLRLYDAIRRAAPLDTPVLIEGPTGSGKELVARALHALSGRAGPLVDVNVATLPETLADAELFGAVRGAYTGATDRGGLIERADGGVLLLDEAGDMAPWLQTKLLRVLETQAVRRIGGQRDRSVRFRLLLTTQRPAVDLLDGGCWRPDFYYRVAGIVLRVPTLAERVSDVPLLVNRFLAELGCAALPEADVLLLATHSWPGNVRELRRAVERAAFDGTGGQVTARAILSCVDGAGPVRPSDARPGRALEELEARRVAAVLREAGFDTAVAARLLDISRGHLYRKMRRLGIPLPRGRGVRPGSR